LISLRADRHPRRRVVVPGHIDPHCVRHDDGTSTSYAVNGARIVTAELAHGDLVRFGGLEFRFERMQ